MGTGTSGWVTTNKKTMISETPLGISVPSGVFFRLFGEQGYAAASHGSGVVSELDEGDNWVLMLWQMPSQPSLMSVIWIYRMSNERIPW